LATVSASVLKCFLIRASAQILRSEKLVSNGKNKLTEPAADGWNATNATNKRAQVYGGGGGGGNGCVMVVTRSWFCMCACVRVSGSVCGDDTRQRCAGEDT